MSRPAGERGLSAGALPGVTPEASSIASVLSGRIFRDRGRNQIDCYSYPGEVGGVDWLRKRGKTSLCYSNRISSKSPRSRDG